MATEADLAKVLRELETARRWVDGRSAGSLAGARHAPSAGAPLLGPVCSLWRSAFLFGVLEVRAGQLLDLGAAGAGCWRLKPELRLGPFRWLELDLTLHGHRWAEGVAVGVRGGVPAESDSLWCAGFAFGALECAARRCAAALEEHWAAFAVDVARRGKRPSLRKPAPPKARAHEAPHPKLVVDPDIKSFLDRFQWKLDE